jgi:hypothetical protein
MDGFADGGIGYTFADTNIHDERLKSTELSTVELSTVLLFGQNQLAVAGPTQAILLAPMLNKYFVTMGKQGIAVEAPVPVQHDELLLIGTGYRHCEWFIH